MSLVENILDLIPQRHPLVLVDSLLHSDAAKSVTGFTVPANHVLVSNGFLREPGILENVAQSAAARGGYQLKQQGLPPKVGFIGDIAKVEILRLPAVGATLKTTVTHLQEVFNITMMRGEVADEQGPIANCEIKIVLQETAP